MCTRKAAAWLGADTLIQITVLLPLRASRCPDWYAVGGIYFTVSFLSLYFALNRLSCFWCGWGGRRRPFCLYATISGNFFHIHLKSLNHGASIRIVSLSANEMRGHWFSGILKRSNHAQHGIMSYLILWADFFVICHDFLLALWPAL